MEYKIRYSAIYLHLIQKYILIVYLQIIYVIRNPEKTCISLYYETNVIQNAHKLESFCDVFLNGQGMLHKHSNKGK